MIRMPASSCVYCRVDLREASRPKKRKTPLLRQLVAFVVIVACFLCVAYFVERLRQTDDFKTLQKYEDLVPDVLPPSPATK
jgi:hypothetical protein